MEAIKAILFDLDGLLIDSEKVYHRVSYQMARALNVDLHDGILSQQMGRSPVASMEIFKRELGVHKFSAQELVDWRDQLMLKAYNRKVDLLTGCREILEAAKKAHLKTAIATGSTRNLVEVVLEKTRLESYFDLVLPSDEIINGKPHPEIYLTAAEGLKTSPKNCVVLEDSANGCKAGIAAGCMVVAVPNEHTEKQDFAGVNYRAVDLNEAWKWISQGL